MPALGLDRRGQHGDVGDAHHPSARVAVGGAVRPQLLEHDVAQAGLLAELALGRGQHVLLLADEAARQREPAAVRRAPRLTSRTRSSSSATVKIAMSTVTEKIG